MKIYSTNCINALGLKGPDETPQKIKEFVENPIEEIIVDNGNIEESENVLYKRAIKILKEDGRKLFIGGDHSITYPLFKAFRETHPNPFLVVFDAHPDCMTPSPEPTHEEFLRAIIEDGFPTDKIILVGTRKVEPEEQKFLYEHKIKVFNDILDLQAMTDYITERANGHNLYISIDIDAIDPAFAPGVNYPEPAGLSSKEFFYILKRLFLIKSLVAVDIVEAVPKKDKLFDYRTLRIIVKIIEMSEKL